MLEKVWTILKVQIGRKISTYQYMKEHFKQEYVCKVWVDNIEGKNPDMNIREIVGIERIRLKTFTVMR